MDSSSCSDLDSVKAIGAQPCHLAGECGGREPKTGERGRTIIGDAVIHEDWDTLPPLRCVRRRGARPGRPAPDDISRDPDPDGRADWHMIYHRFRRHVVR